MNLVITYRNIYRNVQRIYKYLIVTVVLSPHLKYKYILILTDVIAMKFGIQVLIHLKQR